MYKNLDNFKGKRLLNIAFFLIGLIPLTSERLEVIVAALFSVMVLISTCSNFRVNIKFKANSNFIINSLLFVVLITTFIDGVDRLALNKMVQMISLILFPIFLYFISINSSANSRELFDIWKRTFFTSTFLFCLISFFIIYNYSNPKYPFLDSNFFQNAILDSAYFARHPGYISIFINIALLIGLDTIMHEKRITIKLIYGFALIPLLTLLFMLSVKISLVGISVVILVYLCLSLSKKMFLIFFSSIVLGLVTIFSLLPSKLNRMAQLFDTNILSENVQYNSVLVHKLTIICSYEIFKDNILLGVGIENSKDEVNNCVRENYVHNPQISYNSHNQYLGYALHSGVLGLVVFLTVLMMNLCKSFKKEVLLCSILLLYSIVFLTENVLERQSGIILFSFLINMIPLFHNSKKGEKPSVDLANM